VKLGTLPIGARLTAWYIAFLFIGLVAFGALAVVSMRRSIDSTVDEQLRDRMSVVTHVVDRSLRAGNLHTMQRELDEDSELRPESDLLQVSDQNGAWLYQSAAVKQYHLPRSPSSGSASATTLVVEDVPLRSIATTLAVDGQIYQIQVATRMDDFYEAWDRFQKRLFILVPLVLLLASAAGYWTSRRALAPVDQITHAAQQFSTRNLSSRILVPKSGDELQRLSETLNAMLGRVENAVNQITEFTADASHELRTPVTVMRTRTELALRHRRSPDEYRETLEQLHSELVQTSELIDKLMLLARADAGANLLRFASVDLAGVVGQVLSQTAPLAEAKGVEIEAQVGDRPIWVQADKELLQRLFTILIDNAVKYTPAPGRIVVELGSEAGVAMAVVRDTGIGIAAADLPRVFERFYRSDKARSRETGGAGLGLSIARWIAEAHHGSLRAESISGSGAAFTLTLPQQTAVRDETLVSH
jgi:two-component system, OmpR family, heavy metal sensor histidine kinase CusS